MFCKRVFYIYQFTLSLLNFFSLNLFFSCCICFYFLHHCLRLANLLIFIYQFLLLEHSFSIFFVFQFYCFFSIFYGFYLKPMSILTFSPHLHLISTTFLSYFFILFSKLCSIEKNCFCFNIE